MPFDLSQTRPLANPPRKTDGTTLDGAFILLDDSLIDYMQETMTTAQRAEIAPWVNRWTEAQCAEWHVPLWGGQSSAVYLRVPKALWASATTTPPPRIKTYLRALYRA